MTLFLTALTAGVLTIGFVVLNRYLDSFDQRPFTPQTWEVADSYERAAMARDAIRHLPLGTSASRVRAMLGEPGPVPGVSSGSRVDGFGHALEFFETWSYYLGSWSGFGPYAFDSAFLYVHFDAEGNLAGAEITGG